MKTLRDYTTARVALGVSGESLPSGALLDFRLAHAMARDAVRFPLNAAELARELQAIGLESIMLQSAASTRDEYLRRPDLGRRLAAEQSLPQAKTVFIVADGLSALAVHRHAIPLLKEMPVPSPVYIVQQGRVAVSDHIGELAQAELAVILLGERPGLSTPDSLGIYLTWNPRRGRTDAERNCISNIHANGLSYAEAARRLAFLTDEARRRKLSGVALKETNGIIRDI